MKGHVGLHDTLNAVMSEAIVAVNESCVELLSRKAAENHLIGFGSRHLMQSVLANLQSLPKISCQQAVGDGVVRCQPLCDHTWLSEFLMCCAVLGPCSRISFNSHGLR
jgi:hypothetical protein